MEEPKKKKYEAPDAKDLNDLAAQGMCGSGSNPDDNDTTNCTDGNSAGSGACSSGNTAASICSSGLEIVGGPCSNGELFFSGCDLGSAG